MASKGPKMNAGSTATPKASVRRAKPTAAQPPVVPVVEQKPAEPASVTPVVPFLAEQPAAPVIAQTETDVEATAVAAEPVVETVKRAVEEVTGAVKQAAPLPEEPTMIHTNDPVDATAGKAQNLFGDITERSKAAMEKSVKSVEEMADFAKGNVEALVEASRIAAKGLESMGQDAAEFSRRNFENATATMKTLATVKSPTEFFKLQADFFRGAFDQMVAETSKNTEALLKLTNDAAQPISNRVAVATNKLKVAA